MRLFVARIACGSLAATLAFGAAVLPVRVGAQTPPYATPGSGPAIGGETIHGVIESIEGAYRILVRDDRGFVDDVTLRQGTIINPRGLRLRVGMSVTISGFASGSTFSAVEIDAPYSYDGGAAGSTYYSTYPDYGYGYGYGYGDYYVGSPAESVTVIQQPIVVQPPPGAVRRVEPPHANRPLRHPLDGKVDPPLLPPYVVPPTAFRAVPMPGRSGSAPDRAWTAPDRAQAAAPQYRAPAPEYRAPAAPEYHAPPPPPAPRSEPAPAPRENREPSSPAKPH